MDDLCSLKEVGARLYGEAKTDIDPLAKPGKDPSDWGEYLHEQEGGVLSIAGKLGKAAKIDPRGENPPQIKGLLKHHNPLMEKLRSNKLAQEAIFDILAPTKSVAKPILNEYIKARNDFDNYIQADPTVDIAMYKDEVATRATELLKKVEADPAKYGVDSSNVHMTNRFLKQVENGWPYADYGGEKAQKTKDLEHIGVRATRGAASNLMKAHVVLNPMIYLFHMGTTPVRLFSEYPAAATKILPEIFHDPAILIGKKIPEAEAAGVYTKAMDSHNPKDWNKKDWGKGLTGIPQTQTFNESLSFLLSKHGVPLDQALERIALSSRDPLDMPMFATSPDRGGSLGALSYMRYAMYQHAAYLNMVKRAVNFKDPETMGKAMGSLLLYTGINYALYGHNAAVPGSGVVKTISRLGSDGSPDDQEYDMDEFDKGHGGNLVYQATGMDLGEHMSPLSFFDLYHGVKMVETAGKGGYSDFKKLTSDANGLTKTAAAAHLLLLGAEVSRGFPHSVTNMVNSYGRSVDDMADNPMDVDFDTWFNNEIKAHLGQHTATKFKEHANQ